MRSTQSLYVLVVLGLGVGLLPAQVAVGDKAPKIDADEILSANVKSLKEYDGRLILYDFFAHW